MTTPTTEKVRQHLQRILATPAFANSIVLTRFLTFIVNETLDGRSHELKEYTIAIDALKKGADFNPQIDSIVRIHAGRLRRALKEFYYEQGAGEEIEIMVPKGSYIPSFISSSLQNGSSGRSAESDAHAYLTVSKGSAPKRRNSLAMLPFEDISELKTHSSFVKGLEMYLSTCLTKNSQLSVISYLSSSHLPEQFRDIREAGILLNASFILTGCVQFDQHLRIHAVLNSCETGAQVWALTIEKKDIDKTDLFMLQDEIVSKITLDVNQAVMQYSKQDADNKSSVEEKETSRFVDGSRGVQVAN